MSAATLRAPAIEVRIYRNGRLIVRELCHDEGEAATITAQATDLDHVYLLVDDGVDDLGPGDVYLRDEVIESAVA